MTSLVMGLPLDLEFRTKGQLAMDICADCYADGLTFDFICGDEVYGSCTKLREFLEAAGQAYVLRVASELHDHRCPRDQGHLRGGGKIPGERQPALGGPLRRARARRASAGTPGPGSAPPPRATTCWSAAT